MTETYVTYLVWDGCRAPGNLEYNGKLCGQRASAVQFDRAELLALADELDSGVEGLEARNQFMCYKKSTIQEYARRIREACGGA